MLCNTRRNTLPPELRMLYLLTYYEPEMGFVRQPNGKSLDKEAHAPRTPIAPGTPALQ